MRTTTRGDGETVYGYPEDIAIPEEGGVRNEDVVGDERAATVRGRYLARQSDLTDEQAHALAWRELGYTAAAIARELDRAEGTIESWLDRTAAQYCLCAIETKWPAKRGDLDRFHPGDRCSLPKGRGITASTRVIVSRANISPCWLLSLDIE